MASLASRQVSFKNASVAPARVNRTRVVKAQAMQRSAEKHSVASAFAATAAALLLTVSPAMAAPSLLPNPQAELATDPVTKVLKKLDSKDPPKGVPGPEVPGQFRADPKKARALANENTPAGSPEAEAAARKYGEKP